MLLERDRRPRRRAGIVAGVIAGLTTVLTAYASVDPAPVELLHSYDPAIQKIADEEVAAAVARHKAEGAIAIVLDAKTDRVLAVANLKSGERESRQRWALKLRVHAASTIKPLITTLALESGVTTGSESHFCENGKYVVGDKVYHDWKPFDWLTTAETVIHSSNLCSIKIAQKLGAAKLYEGLKSLGLTSVTRPEEIPEPHYTALMGSGFGGANTSALELTRAYRNILRNREMRDILVGVVKRGTGKPAASLRYELAGKTGTAYFHGFRGEQVQGGEPTGRAGTFVGFGPVAAPRVVVYASVFNPTDQKGVHGSTHGGPLFRRLTERVLDHLQP